LSECYIVCVHLTCFYAFFVFFFFFQAEDGIRDFHVTGVQTCALPIWAGRCWCSRARAISVCGLESSDWWRLLSDTAIPSSSSFRSEERRVGKECRSRWARDE